MKLSSDRWEVVASEPVRAVFLVSTPEAVVLTLGGLPHLAHVMEDIGFRDVALFEAPPASWTRGGDAAKPIGLDWLVWASGVPIRTTSLSRTWPVDMTVLDAWPAERASAGPFHPYATTWFAPVRVLVLRVFGRAYPLNEQEDSC